ncbi:MAG: thioesterase family protein [Thermodesulfobacteriota bacterium]
MHLFDQDLMLTRMEDRAYRVRVSDNWSINGIANGGYLLALIAQAMLEQAGKKATPILTANYISRCKPGEALLLVEEIVRSSQFDRLQVRLLQDGREKIRALGTFAAAGDACPPTRYESGPPELPAPMDCFPIPPMPGYTVFDQMDVRLDPACAGWLQGKPLAEKSEHKGWIRFKQDRPFDLTGLVLAADAFPPPVLSSHGAVAWVPTIEFSVSVRNIPREKWLRCIFRSRFINCGLVEEDGEVWDQSGELAAVSRQIAQFRPVAGST